MSCCDHEHELEHAEQGGIQIVANSSDKKFYELLNCVPSSSAGQIKAEYRELSLQFRTKRIRFEIFRF